MYPDAFAGVPSERTADGERASAATSAARSPTDACRAADASKSTSFKDCVQGDPARQHAHPADMGARDVMRVRVRRARVLCRAHARAR